MACRTWLRNKLDPLIDHFMVEGLVFKPLSECEADLYLVWIQTSLLFLFYGLKIVVLAQEK